MLKTLQKRLLILPVMLLAFVLFAFPVSAANSSFPISDGSLSVSYDGVTKTATYLFMMSDYTPGWSVSKNGGSRVWSTGSSYQMSTSTTAIQYSIIGYPFGSEYMDVHDLVSSSTSRIDYSPTISWISGSPSSSAPASWSASCQLRLMYYDSSYALLGNSYYVENITFNPSLSSTVSYSPTYGFTIPENTYYVRPYIQINSSTPANAVFNFSMDKFKISFDTNMVAENSETQKQILEKLDQMQENEKQEANSQGQSGIDDISGAIPDYTEDLKTAFSSLAGSLQYTGTEAKLEIPEVTVPGLEGLYDGFSLMEPQTLDFQVYIDLMPSGLMLLVQSLLTVALILFCIKELYGMICYILTLRGGGSDE